MPDHLPDPETARLATLAANGDEGAFEHLFDRYYSRIRAFAARMVSNISEGEDIAQETFIRAARSICGIQDVERFDSWLFRIAGNLCRDRLRSRMREDHVRATLGESRSDSTGTMDSGQVEDALASLHPDHRAAVLLVYFEGLNHREAGVVSSRDVPLAGFGTRIEMIGNCYRPVSSDSARSLCNFSNTGLLRDWTMNLVVFRATGLRRG